ncbi:MAG: hypothetical protein IJT91_03840 [Clostridia bacterium]|nr:hypothetical protein [Clostridia bacterium]
MKKYIKMTALILAAVMLTVLAACAKNEGTKDDTKATEATEPAGSDAAESAADVSDTGSENTDTEDASDEEEIPDFDDYKTYFNGGYVFSIPSVYDDQLIVNTPENDEAEILLDVYDKEMSEKEMGGHLFSIELMDKEEYENYPQRCALLGNTADGRCIVIVYPSDVQYDITSAETIERWQTYYAWIDKVLPNRFLLDNNM